MSSDPDSPRYDPERGPSSAAIADIARALAAEPTVAATLQRIVDLAVETIDGCDGAGILLVEGHRILLGSWSSEFVRQVETMEFDVGEGPCIDAIGERPTFRTDDLRALSGQWPTFAALALGAGVESMLAFRLFAAEGTLGALNLYSRCRGAFDEAAHAYGAVFAAHAALALAGARIHERDLATVDGLREALVTRDVIGQAKGILMATGGVDAEAAFEQLREVSQRSNRKIRQVAEVVIATGRLPRH